MFDKLYNRSMNYFSRHVFLNSIAHVATGFGIAIVLQAYLQGNVFINVWIGWILIAFSMIIHIRSVTK